MANDLRVLDYIDKEEILAQMGEEASEVAKAALKFRRALSGKNPTPVSVSNAYENLIEEFGDVLNCIYAYFDDNNRDIEGFMYDAERTVESKRYRWIERLKERDQI